MFQKLTGSDGPRFLQQISAHAWADGGTAAADRFAWIKPDALSTDPARAQRAGEAAHTIALFLSEPKYGLANLPTGLFGLRRRSLGELNPNLLAAYAEALTPFQGALVGDLRKSPGFEVVGDPINLASAREVFSNIDTNTSAGAAFNNAAYERVEQYLRAYAESVASHDTDNLVALQFAAGLAGVVEGGRRKSANTALQISPAQHFLNLARYEVAKAMGVEQERTVFLRDSLRPKASSNLQIPSPREIFQNSRPLWRTSHSKTACQIWALTFDAGMTSAPGYNLACAYDCKNGCRRQRNLIKGYPAP